MPYRVVISTEAAVDLKTAANYIRRDSRTAALRWNKQIRARIATLASNPDRCVFAPEAETLTAPVRQLLFGSGNRGTYRIVFVMLDLYVVILHVRHGSMLPKTPDD